MHAALRCVNNHEQTAPGSRPQIWARIPAWCAHQSLYYANDYPEVMLLLSDVRHSFAQHALVQLMQVIEYERENRQLQDILTQALDAIEDFKTKVRL